MCQEADYIPELVSRAVEAGADLVELRFDSLLKPNLQLITDIMNDLDHPFIATNRPKFEGGFFKGTERERIDLLQAASKYASFVDIELQTKPKYKSEIISSSQSSIVSYHNFQETPSAAEIMKIINKAKDEGDLAKFAVMPRNMQDTLTVLEILSSTSRVIGISMGDLGRYTRIIGPLFGSPITYASLDAESAPGQLDIKTTQTIINKLVNSGDEVEQ